MSSRIKRLRLFVIACICVFALPANGQSRQAGESRSDRRPQAFRLREPEFLRSFRPAIENAYRSVVRVERYDERDGVWIDAALGVVIDTDGSVLTKSSELIGTLRCTTALYRNLDATVVGRDKANDLALVHVEKPSGASSPPFEPITWDDTPPQVGRWVVTAGIDRMPLAVGVVSVENRLIQASKEPPYLGIIMVQENPGSPQIESLSRHGAADRAGLRPGDVIRKVNGQIVPNNGSLQYRVQRHHPGDEVSLTIIREGTEFEVQATLQHVPQLTEDLDKKWNDVRSRWTMMNELGSRLSIRRDNFPSAVQHDTVLRPEDCGGIAVNLQGKAVGMNIARAGRTESLLIPASQVRAVAARLQSQAASRMTSAGAGDQ